MHKKCPFWWQALYKSCLCCIWWETCHVRPGLFLVALDRFYFRKYNLEAAMWWGKNEVILQIYHQWHLKSKSATQTLKSSWNIQKPAVTLQLFPYISVVLGVDGCGGSSYSTVRMVLARRGWGPDKLLSQVLLAAALTAGTLPIPAKNYTT